MLLFHLSGVSYLDIEHLVEQHCAAKIIYCPPKRLIAIRLPSFDVRSNGMLDITAPSKLEYGVYIHHHTTNQPLAALMAGAFVLRGVVLQELNLYYRLCFLFRWLSKLCSLG